VVSRATESELDLVPAANFVVGKKEAPIEFSAIRAERIYLAVRVPAPEEAFTIAP
jgi:hypothetical protein